MANKQKERNLGCFGILLIGIFGNVYFWMVSIILLDIQNKTYISFIGTGLYLFFVLGLRKILPMLFPGAYSDDIKKMLEQPTRETHGYSIEVWELNKNDILDALKSTSIVEKDWALNELKKFSLQVIEPKEILEKWLYSNDSDNII
jgi:hypothetical protein